MLLVAVTQDSTVLISIEMHAQFLSQHRRTTITIYPASRLYSDIRFEMVTVRIMNKGPELYLNPHYINELEIISHCLRNLFRIENQYLNFYGEFGVVTNSYLHRILQSTIKQRRNISTL
eukprot:298720_1